MISTFLGIVHTFASVDAGIMGAGLETMHQRCFLGVKVEDFDQRVMTMHQHCVLEVEGEDWN